MSQTPLTLSGRPGDQPVRTVSDPSVRIVVQDMFDGNVEQFDDTFGSEPGGLTLDGFLNLAARRGLPVRIEITPPATPRGMPATATTGTTPAKAR